MKLRDIFKSSDLKRSKKREALKNVLRKLEKKQKDARKGPEGRGFQEKEKENRGQAQDQQAPSPQGKETDRRTRLTE